MSIPSSRLVVPRYSSYGDKDGQVEIIVRKSRNPKRQRAFSPAMLFSYLGRFDLSLVYHSTASHGTTRSSSSANRMATITSMRLSARSQAESTGILHPVVLRSPPSSRESLTHNSTYLRHSRTLVLSIPHQPIHISSPPALAASFALAAHATPAASPTNRAVSRIWSAAAETRRGRRCRRACITSWDRQLRPHQMGD